MKKNILIIGLGWQGQKFLEYFLKDKKYFIIGCCKTIYTKKKIEDKYGIQVTLNYKNIINKKYDLIISTVYPTDIQYEIVKYILENTNNKVLIDLPISFNLNDLNYLLSFDKLFLFNIEHYTKIFHFVEKNKNNILIIDAILFINKDNLKKQTDAKKALLVDKFYMMNNLMNLELKKIRIFYKEVKRNIKDIEFVFKIFLKNKNKILYKYEDSKGIFIHNNRKMEIDNLKYTFIFDKLLLNIFSDNFLEINKEYKRKHYEYWSNFIN